MLFLHENKGKHTHLMHISIHALCSIDKHKKYPESNEEVSAWQVQRAGQERKKELYKICLNIILVKFWLFKQVAVFHFQN